MWCTTIPEGVEQQAAGEVRTISWIADRTICERWRTALYVFCRAAFAFAGGLGLYTQSVQIACPTVTDEDPRPWLEIRRTLKSRQHRRKPRWLLEIIGIALVLVVSISTAWWTASEFHVESGGFITMVESLVPPRSEPEHRIVGYTGQENSAHSELHPNR